MHHIAPGYGGSLKIIHESILLQIQMLTLGTFTRPQELALSENNLNGYFPTNWTLPRSLRHFQIWRGPL